MIGDDAGRRSTALAGVIGWPIHHSRSPRLHGHWLRRYGIDGAFVPMAVPPDRLAAGLDGLRALGFRGANVTVPHKEAVIPLLDRCDAHAARIGAVNTIVIASDGAMEGRNTDGVGFLENLRAQAPVWNPDRPAVVLGAGGAARAVLVALSDAGCPEIRLANRTRERAARLAADLGEPIRVVDWADRAESCAGTGLLVNTSSLGMVGQPPLEFGLDALPPDAVVNDIVYTPLQTPLLAAAAACGLHAVDGLGMLLHQAKPGFQAWFGVEPTVDSALRTAVLAG